MIRKEGYIDQLVKIIGITKARIDATSKLIPAMHKLSGKNIRQMKFIKQKLSEALPGYCVTFGEKYSWYEIRVTKTIEGIHSLILSVNCGYINEVSTFDAELIIGTKERKTGGTLGNNYYFGTEEKYPNCKTDLIKFEKQLKNVEKDFARYLKLHEEIKNFNVPFLSIEVRR